MGLKFKANLARPNTFLYDPENKDVLYRDYDGAFYDTEGNSVNINEDYDKVPEVIQLNTKNVLPGGLFASRYGNLEQAYADIVIYCGRGFTIYDYNINGRSVESIELCRLDTNDTVDISKNVSITIYDPEHLEREKEMANHTSVVAPVDNSAFNTADFFRLVDRCVYDFRTGNLGVKKADNKGFSVFVPAPKTNSKPSVKNCELKEFGTGIPAVAMRAPIDKLKAGDMVIIKDNSGAENWLYYLSTDTEGDTTNIEISGIETDTGKKVSLAVQDGMLLDGNSVLCVKNFLGDKKSMKSMLPMMLLMGQNQGGQQMNPMVMMMLMGDGEFGSGGMSEMLPLLLLSGQQGGGAGVDQNTLLMLMLMGKDKGDSKMSKMLPLMLLGGQNGQQMNPMMLMMMMGMFDEKEESTPAVAK